MASSSAPGMHGTIDGMSSSVAHALAIGRPTRNEFSIFIRNTARELSRPPPSYEAGCPIDAIACCRSAAHDVQSTSLSAQTFCAPHASPPTFANSVQWNLFLLIENYSRETVKSTARRNFSQHDICVDDFRVAPTKTDNNNRLKTGGENHDYLQRNGNRTHAERNCSLPMAGAGVGVFGLAVRQSGPQFVYARAVSERWATHQIFQPGTGRGNWRIHRCHQAVFLGGSGGQNFA